MTYVLLSLGSRGDVAPMVALGRELRRRGEQVTLVGLAEYAVLAERAGLAFEPVRATLAEALWVDRPWVRRAMLAQSGLMYLGMLERFTSSATRVADAILRAVRPGDVVVSGLVTLDAVRALADTGNLGTALALFSPVLPSADPESTIWSLPLLGAGLISQAMSAVGWTLSSRLSVLVGRQIRTRLGLASAFGRTRAAPRLPLLLGTSPVLVPAAPDWPSGLVQTGAWTEPHEVTTADLPSGVRAFLAAGEPPVYVGFGSMPAADPAADLALFARAARRARRRLVVQPSPGVDLDEAVDGYDDVLRLPELPHERLFPHLAGIVHHGGAGTTVAALRAGLPSAMVPHLGDQGYWGRRVASLGAGPPPVPRRQLTEASLARLIGSVAGSGAVRRRRRAVELSACLDAERGTAVAADAVQALA